MASDTEFQLIARVVQLEQQQIQLKKYIAILKRRLEDHRQHFNTRPEPQQLAEIQENLLTLQNRLDELSEKLDSISLSSQTETALSTEVISTAPLLATEVIPSPPESQLIFDRSRSRNILLEALSTAAERIIIICPWLNSNSIDRNLLQKFRDCLSRGCQIEIGWGHSSDRHKISQDWRYNALGELQNLQREYPKLLRLKLLGTHENYLVCDTRFALVGSHNLLASGGKSTERDTGIFTTDPKVVHGLIQRFDQTKEPEKMAKVQQFNTPIKPLYQAKSIQEVTPTLTQEEDLKLEITTKEFLYRYKSGKRNFKGINLAGINLSGKSFSPDVNLSKANLIGANLSNTDLRSVNLSNANLEGATLKAAKLSGANLSEANLSQAQLMQSDLSYANLEAANLSQSNLKDVIFSAANFSKAQLAQTDLSGIILSKDTNFSEANLNQANLNGLNLRAANLMGASLTEANLSRTNLLWANLEAAKLDGANLQQAICNPETIFPPEFNPVEAGAYLLTTGASLKDINLVRADLSNIDLSGSDLSGADLSLTNLNNADLRDTNLSSAKLQRSSLDVTNLDRANLNNADLKNASLVRANLTQTTLHGSDLRQVDFGSAKLIGAELT
ncbi:MAG: pentapeptide repeat-containing protein, partial [Cyanobacteriota bacterium]|nr:pentapeptide repeat-containing protein [Cyanobacteriota bacterium]